MAKEHHWCGKKPNPQKYFGFIYEITNLITGRKYIGKKQYYRYKKGTYKITGKQAWEYYTGSNTVLNDDIKKLGKENFKFKIMEHTENRMMHTYKEVKRIIKCDAVLEDNEDKYYNAQTDKIRRRVPSTLRNGVKWDTTIVTS